MSDLKRLVVYEDSQHDKILVSYMYFVKHDEIENILARLITNSPCNDIIRVDITED